MGQGQSTNASQDRGVADSQPQADYYTILGVERDATEEE